MKLLTQLILKGYTEYGITSILHCESALQCIIPARKRKEGTVAATLSLEVMLFFRRFLAWAIYLDVSSTRGFSQSAAYPVSYEMLHRTDEMLQKIKFSAAVLA